MSLLGNFLESFYGSEHLFHTVRAKVRRECIPNQREVTSRRPPIGKAKTPSTTSKIIVESDFRAVLPDHVRVDATRTKNEKVETTVEIVRESERLKRSPDGSLEVGEARSRRLPREGDSLPTEYRRHFDRRLIRQFFASLVLEDAGKCIVAGRDCVRIRAIPIEGDSLWPHWLPSEADEFEFAADLEFPSLLAISGLQSKSIIEHMEVIQVTFDEQIDESIFEIEPTSGQTVRPLEPVTQRISLEAARSKVPFAVLLPKKGVAGCDIHLQYAPAKPGGPGQTLTVFYTGIDSNSLWFKLHGQPDTKEDEKLVWEKVEVSGRRFEISDPETEGGMFVLRFNQDGTWIEVFSDHSRQELLEIAMSFEKV